MVGAGLDIGLTGNVSLILDGFYNLGLTKILGLVRTWDIHPDGSRFIMVASEGGEAGAGGGGQTEVYLVVCWFEELRQRMGN